MERLAREFEQTCTGTTLQLNYVPREQILARFQETHASAANDTADPDMLHLSSRWLAPLAEAGLLLNLTERVSADSLQQFLPETVETMRYDGRLYGIPESLEVLALFHNLDYISDPPIDMEQLTLTVESDTRLALPVGFFWGYWGMDPFGGFEFDSYSGRITEVEGLTNWLNRLQRRDPEAGIDLYFDDAAAEDAFAFEEAVYLVSGPWSLPRLRQELGNDRFRVAPLPNGPLMAGRPMLQVTGTVVSIDADDLEADTAIAFSHFLNLPSSQLRLAATGNHISASVTVDLNDHPNLQGFREQAKFAALVVENSNFTRLEAQGDLLYEAVLIDGVEPEVAVPAFVEAVHRENGVE
jgi:maltose-binding protein MalE